MVDEPKGKEPQTTPEPQAPATPVAPQPTPSVTPEVKPSMSDEQVASLKDSITKDVSGQVSQEVSKSVIQKIGEALGLTKREEDKLPTDAEALQKLVDQKLEERFSKLSEEAENEEKEEKTARQERINGIVNGWYTQYNILARQGKVPPVKNAGDENDPGLQARKKIILAIGKMIEQNKAQGIDYTPTISDVLVTYPQVLQGPPGADLPISGNTAVRENEDSFKYENIHKKTFEEIAEGV